MSRLLNRSIRAAAPRVTRGVQSARGATLGRGLGARIRSLFTADWIILALGFAALVMGAWAVASMAANTQVTLADVMPARPST